jgi:hypothetical protein
MLLHIRNEADLDGLRDVLTDAALREATFHLADGQMVFRCDMVRPVPDQAEEYWAGPIHKTRIPWTRCVLELSGITRCQMRELDDASHDGMLLLGWEKQAGHYLVSVQTPLRMEMVLVLKRLHGCCEDVGELNWHP